MSDTDELWVRVLDDYRKAYTVVERVWPKDTPPEVRVEATATALNHYRETRRAMLPHNQPQATAPSENGHAADPAPDGCPQCGGEMYDNRGDKKHARSPDFKCKDPECGKAIWLTPPPKGAKARR